LSSADPSALLQCLKPARLYGQRYDHADSVKASGGRDGCCEELHVLYTAPFPR
jgi:hypothetical protein